MSEVAGQRDVIAGIAARIAVTAGRTSPRWEKE